MGVLRSKKKVLFSLQAMIIILAVCFLPVLNSIPVYADDTSTDSSTGADVEGVDGTTDGSDVAAPPDDEIRRGTGDSGDSTGHEGSTNNDTGGDEGTGDDSGDSTEGDTTTGDESQGDGADEGDNTQEGSGTDADGSENTSGDENTGDDESVGEEDTGDTDVPDANAGSVNVATVETDKADYGPQDTVAITGGGFTPNSEVTLSITEPTGAVKTWSTTADESGRINTTYQLENGSQEEYFLTATDEVGTAQSSFTDCWCYVPWEVSDIEASRYWISGNPESLCNETTLSQTVANKIPSTVYICGLPIMLGIQGRVIPVTQEFHSMYGDSITDQFSVDPLSPPSGEFLNVPGATLSWDCCPAPSCFYECTDDWQELVANYDECPVNLEDFLNCFTLTPGTADVLLNVNALGATYEGPVHVTSALFGQHGISCSPCFEWWYNDLCHSGTTINVFGVDSTSPELVKFLDSPEPDKVVVTLKGYDMLSGMKAIKYNVDEEGWITYGDPFTLTGEPGKTFYLQHIGYDNACNPSDLPAQTVTIPGGAQGDQPTVAGQEIVIDMLGKVGRYPVTVDGRLLVDVELSSIDNNLTVMIPVGTQVLNANGRPTYMNKDPDIFSITAATPVPPAGYEMLAAYEFLPSGITFSGGQVTMSIGYDRERVTEGSLPVIAFYDETLREWVEQETVGRIAAVDGELDMVSSRVNHFTYFAVLSKTSPEQ